MDSGQRERFLEIVTDIPQKNCVRQAVRATLAAPSPSGELATLAAPSHCEPKTLAAPSHREPKMLAAPSTENQQQKIFLCLVRAYPIDLLKFNSYCSRALEARWNRKMAAECRGIPRNRFRRPKEKKKSFFLLKLLFCLV